MEHENHSKDETQPATQGDLKALRQNLANEITKRANKTDGLIKGLETKLETWKDKIITSNDKVVKEVEHFRSESAAIKTNYDNLDKRMDKVEVFAEEAADITGVEFTKAV